MKSKLTMLLAFVFVCACSGAMANSTYIDNFTFPDASCVGCTIYPYPSGPPALPLLQYSGSLRLFGYSLATYNSPGSQVFMTLDFTAPVASFDETVTCYSTDCVYHWFGTFKAGTALTISSVTILTPPQTFTTNLIFNGTITDGGTFDGAFCLACWPTFGYGNLSLHVPLAGSWNNGWKSQGNLDVWDDNLDGPFPRLALTTTVPEPGSLVILASGLTLLTGVLRRKLLP